MNKVPSPLCHTESCAVSGTIRCTCHAFQTIPLWTVLIPIHPRMCPNGHACAVTAGGV